MNIEYCTDYEEMSQRCSNTIIEIVKENPDLLLCAATGNSPEGVYQNLAATFLQKPELFINLRIMKLDEWGGIPASDPNSCEAFLRQHILQPLNISAERYMSFEGNATSPEKECERIQAELQKNGPIDLCILGLGKNGHIGFNEPADALTPHCHVARLSQDSLQHQMANAMQNKPIYGLTLGMADILRSKKIVLLLTGSDKKHVIDRLLTQQVTTQLPASFLWLHPNVSCFVDLNAM